MKEHMSSKDISAGIKQWSLHLPKLGFLLDGTTEYCTMPSSSSMRKVKRQVLRYAKVNTKAIGASLR